MNRLALACVMFLLVFVSGCSDKHAFPAGELPIGGEEETYYMKGVWVATAANIDYLLLMKRRKSYRLVPITE